MWTLSEVFVGNDRRWGPIMEHTIYHDNNLSFWLFLVLNFKNQQSRTTEERVFVDLKVLISLFFHLSFLFLRAKLITSSRSKDDTYNHFLRKPGRKRRKTHKILCRVSKHLGTIIISRQALKKLLCVPCRGLSVLNLYWQSTLLPQTHPNRINYVNI